MAEPSESTDPVIPDAEERGSTVTKLLLVPLEDIVVFPHMNVTLTVDVSGEETVFLVPKHDGEYAAVGTVASVTDVVRLPGGGKAEMGFEWVRHAAKEESPLVQLQSSPTIITTIADVTFWGTDQVGNDISVTGSMQIDFGNFGDF